MKKKGFTLVELLAAVVILGLVTAIAVFGISKYIEYSKENKLKYIIKNLKQSAEIKYNLEEPKSRYNLTELLEDKDLKSPYGGQLEGVVYNICDENNSCKFVDCITPNSVITLDSGSIACDSEKFSKESAKDDDKESISYTERYNSTILRLSDDKESDKEDFLYKGDYYVDDGDKIIKITDNNKKLLIHQEVEYHYDVNKYLDCIVLANDGTKATLLAIGSNDSEMNSKLSGVYSNYKYKKFDEYNELLNYYKTKLKTDVRYLDIGDIKAMSYFDNDIKLDADSNLSSSSFSNGKSNILLDNIPLGYWLNLDSEDIWIQYESNNVFDKNKKYFRLHYTSSKEYTGFELIKRAGYYKAKLGLVIETQNYDKIKQLSTTIE